MARESNVTHQDPLRYDLTNHLISLLIATNTAPNMPSKRRSIATSLHVKSTGGVTQRCNTRCEGAN